MKQKRGSWRVILAAIAVFQTPETFITASVSRNPSGRILRWLHDGFVNRWMGCFYCIDLWFSLPVTVWLKSSCIGMALHWRAVPGSARQQEKFTPRLNLAIPKLGSREGGETCAAEKGETQ